MTLDADAGARSDRTVSSVPVVRVRGVTKAYDAVTALAGVDLEVGGGEVYGLLGPNGAGKTTLMRVLLGLVRPDDGAVTVLGRPPGAPAALRSIGALIERPAFVPHLSGRTNLRVLSRARGLRDDEADRVLGVVELTGRADDRYSGYSLGMGQRLGVAAALLGDPRLLILDEPTNGLDPEGVASMRALVRRLGSDGTTVLLSSHLLSEVQQVCERVVVLDRGRVIAEDAVDELRLRAGGTVLRVDAGPADRARAVLAEFAGADAVTPVDDDDGGGGPGWQLPVEPEDVPRLVRALVEAGVDVHELRRERRSLEDVFFALTRDAEGESA
ncbi:ABC transporter ATP-binding protein [Jiangella endophytica]|uniref:ABC transporter ATP-binding protein n=1 Tax=Jiangella endophytica TaxID=1623398 RepID=UPI000E34E8B4|nr:ATP-binding cassette domain-containing protein [Jiangella endophytica]